MIFLRILILHYQGHLLDKELHCKYRFHFFGNILFAFGGAQEKVHIILTGCVTTSSSSNFQYVTSLISTKSLSACIFLRLEDFKLSNFGYNNCTWSLVPQYCIHLLLRELCSSVTLTMHVAHKHHLYPVFIGAGTTHHRKDLVKKRCKTKKDLWSYFFEPE